MSNRSQEPEWPIVGDGRTPTATVERGRSWNPVLLALGLLLVIAAGIWLVSGNRNPDQDKLTGREEAASNASSPERLCASRATYDLIKRDLFRRAAQLRGSDQAAFDRLSAAASLRMQNPVMESENSETGSVQCSGSLAVDLPPGVAVVGGRRTLSSDVNYTVQPAADGSGTVVLLRNVDAIVTPLATLARTEQPPAPPETTIHATPGEVAQPSAPTPPRTVAPPAQPQQRAGASATPSFNCSKARTRGEFAVCNEPSLASLDRAMASEYSRAFAAAPGPARELLRQTAHRFYAYRDRCPDTRCIADAYTGRIREIRDIAQGHWQQP